MEDRWSNGGMAVAWMDKVMTKVLIFFIVFGMFCHTLPFLSPPDSHLSPLSSFLSLHSSPISHLSSSVFPFLLPFSSHLSCLSCFSFSLPLSPLLSRLSSFLSHLLSPLSPCLLALLTCPLPSPVYLLFPLSSRLHLSFLSPLPCCLSLSSPVRPLPYSMSPLSTPFLLSPSPLPPLLSPLLLTCYLKLICSCNTNPLPLYCQLPSQYKAAEVQ